MTEDSNLNRYLDEIGRESLLTSEEEARLSQRIKAGDERALSKLVEANLRFVVKIASQYRGKGVDLDDLISEGNLGLMKAAAKFDATKGVRFVNFAVVYIRQKMERAIEQHTTIFQVPKNSPTAHVDRQNSHPVSYDAPLGHRTNMSLLSVLMNPNAPIADERVYSAALRSAVETALEGLDAREQRVVNAFFGIDREHETMAEIAEDMGLKRERVRQIRDKAVRKLRKSYKAFLRTNSTTFST